MTARGDPGNILDGRPSVKVETFTAKKTGPSDSGHDKLPILGPCSGQPTRPVGANRGESLTVEPESASPPKDAAAAPQQQAEGGQAAGPAGPRLAELADIAAAILLLSAQMRELPGTIEATVSSAIDANLPVAIQERSAAIQRNVMQSMTVELDGMVAARTAHFATQDAVASVDGRVAAVQEEIALLKDQFFEVNKSAEALDHDADSARMAMRRSKREKKIREHAAGNSDVASHGSSRSSSSSDASPLSSSSSSDENVTGRRMPQHGRRSTRSSRRGRGRWDRAKAQREEMHRTGKGLKYRGLKELTSSYESFNIALSYRRYRLLNSSQFSGPKVSALIGQYQRLYRHAMKRTCSRASDQ